jgi:phenylalanyl-tRNA synthetase beta chain
MDANKLFETYRADKTSKLADYLPLIEDSPVYPVILDKNEVVCSLPPIINGEHSKMTP